MLNTTQPIFYINTFTSFFPSLPIIAKHTQNTTSPLPPNSSLQWVGKAPIRLWLVPPLLCCKRGSDSCRKWRRGGRSKSFCRCCRKPKGLRPQQGILSLQDFPSNLMWCFLLVQVLLQQTRHSLWGLICSLNKLTIVAWKLFHSQPHHQQQVLQENMTTRNLIPLFIYRKIILPPLSLWLLHVSFFFFFFVCNIRGVCN